MTTTTIAPTTPTTSTPEVRVAKFEVHPQAGRSAHIEFDVDLVQVRNDLLKGGEGEAVVVITLNCDGCGYDRVDIEGGVEDLHAAHEALTAAIRGLDKLLSAD